MTENVEGFEVTWDENYFYLKFVDLFGDGEQYGFTADELMRVRDLINEALEKWEQLDEEGVIIPDKIFGTNLPPDD